MIEEYTLLEACQIALDRLILNQEADEEEEYIEILSTAIARAIEK